MDSSKIQSEKDNTFKIRHCPKTAALLIQNIKSNILNKNDQVFLLALLTVTGDSETRDAIFSKFAHAFETPETLFLYIKNYREVKKAYKKGVNLSRELKRAVANWYNCRSPSELVEHCTKYKQRYTWSHKDLLRLTHVKPKDRDHELIFKFLTTGTLTFEESEVTDVKAFERLLAMDEVFQTRDESKVVRLIEKYKLALEHIPTEWLKSERVLTSLANNNK